LLPSLCGPRFTRSIHRTTIMILLTNHSQSYHRHRGSIGGQDGAPDSDSDLDAMFEEMQTPEFRAAIEKTFCASPEELRQHAKRNSEGPPGSRIKPPQASRVARLVGVGGEPNPSADLLCQLAVRFLPGAPSGTDGRCESSAPLSRIGFSSSVSLRDPASAPGRHRLRYLCPSRSTCWPLLIFTCAQANQRGSRDAFGAIGG
jgi:hypothetical protein